MKQLEPVGADSHQDKKNMMFSGTTVSNGAAVGIIVATGMSTEIGKIQKNVQRRLKIGKTPLGQKINAFGELLAKVRLHICGNRHQVMNFRRFSDPVHGGF